MMKSNKILLILNVSVLIIIIGVVVVFLSGNHSAPLYQDSSNSNIDYANYQKVLANSSIDDSRQTVITETVKKISPAVVGINVTEIQQMQSPFGGLLNDPFFQHFFGGQNYSQKVKELGSGYIISPDGYIITNDHVAGNASEITVTLTNGKSYPAKLIGTDHATDICLLKIDGSDFPYVTLGNSDNIIIGEWVIAFGNPFGLFSLNDKPTVTVGVVSSTGMNLEQMDQRYYVDMIQTDAAINGGNSGGPLVNSLGQVIGMNTLIYTAGGVKGNIGLGFAIPINKVKKIITQLKENGKMDRNFKVGLRIQGIDEGIAKYYKLKTTKGVIITQILPKTPAAKSGLKEGDIVLQVNDYDINNEQAFIGAFQEFTTGDTVSLTILRDGNEITKKLKLEKQ